jgi:hypothetical protein
MSLDSARAPVEATNQDAEQLTIDRADVLRQIEHTQRSRKETHKLPQLWQSYNGIMDSFIEMDTKSRCDPMVKLPAELLWDIMQEAVTTHRLGKEQINLSRTLALASVSRRWQHFIFGMPSLWTSLDVNPRLPDYREKANQCLVLSQGHPLHLCLTVPPEGWEDILPTLVQNQQRIQEISIYGSPLATSSCSMDTITSTLEKLLPMPKLARIIIFPTQLNRDALLSWLLERCNSLQEVPFPFFVVKKHMLHLDSFRQLRVAFIYLGLDDFMPIQKKMPMLTDLNLTEYPLHLTTDSSSVSRVETSEDDSSPLKWESLRCSHPNTQNFQLHIKRMENLVQLNLTTGLELLRQLLGYLDQLPSLQRLLLQLEVFTVRPEISFPLTNVRPNRNIEYFNLYAREVGFSISPDIHLYQTWNSAGISEALLKAMPALQEVRLNLSHSNLLSFTQLYESDALSNIQRWSLSLPSKESLQQDYRLPLSIQTVQIQSPPELWSRFSSPSARGLTLLSMVDNKRTFSATPTLEAEKWPAIESLTIHTPHFIQANTDFAHLTQLELTINVKDPPERTLFGNEDATRICWRLASNPCLLPSLTTLTIRGIPQWDILLVMLKRRNITTIEGIAPIRSLGIVAHHSKEIKGRIVNLLKRKYEAMSNLRDLSVRGTLEKIEDLSM